MFTSQKYNLPENSGRNRETLIKFVIPYAAVSVFLIVFARVYAVFSHGVDSAYMTYAFLYPALLGAGVGTVLYFLKVKLPGWPARDFYNSGIACITVSSLLTGVFEIAGTSSVYPSYLSFAGWVLILVAVVIAFALYAWETRHFRKEGRKRQTDSCSG